MKPRHQLPLIALVAFLMVFNTLAVMTTPPNANSSILPEQQNDNSIIPQYSPDTTMIPSDQGWSTWSNVSSGLPTQAYGNRSDTIDGNQIQYFSSNSSTSNASVSIPMETDWEGHELFVGISDLTENRTWVEDPDMENSPSTWTLDTVSVGGDASPSAYWVNDGHGSGDDCVEFEIAEGGDPSVGERAWAEQTFTVDRGDVVWAGFRLDYWVESDWGPDGFVAIFVSIETNDYTQRVWQKSFADVPAEMVWYDSGLIVIPDLTIFDLSDGATITVGLYSQQTVNYSPDLDPYARVDNVELYLQTKTDPTDINLKMNGISVNDYSAAGSTVPGLGNVTQIPSPTWTSSPVNVEFSWTPTPSTPDPNRIIFVDFNVETNLYARVDLSTVTTQNPTSYGENFEATNSSEVEYLTWFFADIPDGYDNRYYFNLSLPEGRDVYYIGSPLLTHVNISTWDEGHGPEWFANISAYNYADRWGYWLIQSKGDNMITDLYMTRSGVSARSFDLRAADASFFSVDVGAQFAGLPVNLTVFSPSGSNWYSEFAIVNSTGFANSKELTFGTNATAGQWIVQAFCNNSIAGSDWNKTGFFRRSFNIIHASESTLLNPSDAVSTWTTNVTYPDLFLVRLRVNDSDIPGTTVSGGQMSYNWTTGTEYFGEGGNGEYLITLDTGDLPQKGQYILNLEWNHPYFDTIQEVLTINLNFDGVLNLEAPDSPGLSIPFGYNGSFQIGFEDYLGAPITTGIVDCNWSSYYSVTPVAGSPGSYQFWLNTSFVDMGEYVVEVTGTAPYILPQRYLLYVEVRELYTKVTYLQNVVSIPVGEANSLTFEWTDADHGTALTGLNNSILCDWAGSYSIDEISPGLYNLTIFTTDVTPLGTTSVKVSFSGAMMQNHTISIQVIVSSHSTLFTLEDPIMQTSYGVDAFILVEYIDTDLGIGIDNSSTNIHISVTTPDLPSLIYSVTDLGSGLYNITVPTSQWSTVGWKNFTIEISWTGVGEKFQTKSLDTLFRLIGTQTDLYLETAPVATYYLDNFTFSAVFYDVVNSTYISNSSGAVFLSFTPIGINPVSGNDFFVEIVIDGPSVIYEFHLNSTQLEGVGMFEVEIAFQWKSGFLPRYENQTINIFLMVFERPTYVDYTQVPPTAYGEDAYFVFSFVDSLRAERIADTISLNIDINEPGINWTILYDSGTREFSIIIDTSSLSGIGSVTLHLNLTWSGSPFYTDIQNHEFTVMVLMRSSQLTHLPFTPGQWGNNVTIEFVFTDTISGSTVGMLGDLTLDVDSDYYTVTMGADGHFTVILNSSILGDPGFYFINASIVYTGSNYVTDTFEYFGFTVLERLTQLGYESPDNAPYLSNVTFIITYIDDSTGSGITGAIVQVASAPLTLVLGTDYWITDMGLGEYLIEINSTSLGSPATYVLNVTASLVGAPHYQTSLRTLSANVVERPTQIRLLETPKNTPFFENITFSFIFEDFLEKSSITIDKSLITLSHGVSSIVITSSEYTLTNFGSYFEISFNSTVLDALSLVSNHELSLFINWISGSPYYSDRTIITQVTTTFRPTIILFPLVEETPYYDNITINLEYRDYLMGIGIDGADVTLSCNNWSIPAYQVVTLGGGLYQLLVNSTVFGSTGTVYFNISLTYTGSPFYANREAINIPSEIRLVKTSLLAEAPPAGSTAVGVPIIVVLSLGDFDHGTSLEGAVIAADWTVVTGNSYQWEEIGDGVYELSLNTTGLLAQQFSITVTATKAFYQVAQAQGIVQPGTQTVDIILSQTTYYGDWGETLEVSFWIQEPYYMTYIAGFNSSLLWNNSVYYFDDVSNGYYTLTLDTADFDFGIYTPQITVTREFYQTRQKSFTLVVSKAPGQIIPFKSTYDAVIDTTTIFEVYLNNTVTNSPVVGASATMEWNGTVTDLTPTGVPGWYTGSVDGTGFTVGVFPVTIRAVITNVQFIEINIDINIIPIPTTIALDDGTVTRFVFFGETLLITAEYNDTYYNVLIDGATVSYTLGSLSGIMFDHSNGSYSASIDISSLSSQSIYLRLVANKLDYATALKSIIVTILPIPTEASVAASDTLQSGYYGDTLFYRFYYDDLQHIVGIEGANLIASWDGGNLGEPQRFANGTYILSVDISLTTPGLYDLVVRFNLLNYTSRTVTAKIEIYATPATIVGLSEYSSPINDTIEIEYEVLNDLDESQITDIIGIASSPQLGDFELELLDTGEYLLTVGGNLPYGTYYFDIYFSTTKYVISPISLEITVRKVRTSLLVSNITILTQPTSSFNLEITYLDLDHNVGISNAIFTLDYSNASLYYYDDLMTEVNGLYIFRFRADVPRTLYVTVTLEKEGFDTQVIEFRISSDVSEAQQFQQNVVITGGFGLLVVALLIVGYVRIWSIPILIRALTRMIRALRKGRIPSPPKVSSRQLLAMAIVNEDLESVKLQKPLEDIAPEPVVTTVPEVNDLLEELASITGLGEAEIEAFRSDLARMKASERTGFLKEVIDQEKARRANVLAGPVKEVAAVEDVPLADLPGELEDLRKKLLKKGMAGEEIDIIIQEARSLSKADLDALLDSLGIDLD